MHVKLFGNQQAFDRMSLEKYAHEIGLDFARFKATLDDGKFKDAVQRDVRQANEIAKDGIGTPSFFINGRKIEGAMPFESFKQVIDEELVKKHLAMR